MSTKITEFERANELGIGSVSAVDFFPYTEVDGKYTLAPMSEINAKLANDAAMTTSANIGIPALLVTYLDPRVCEVLFGAMNAGRIFEKSQIGKFEDDFATFMVEEIAGQVSPYADFGNGTAVDVNYNYPVRQNFRYQTTLKYGDLEVSKAALAKINLAARKQYASAQVMARAENAFQLYGVKGMEIYGLLNDPNLPASITPHSIGGNTTWESKINADPNNASTLVFNDVNKLIGELMARNGGLIDANTPMILGISNKQLNYLTQPNNFGKSALELLKGNYPALTVVQLPELSTTSGEMLYLTVPELLGDKTGETAYSRAYMLGRLVPKISSWEQKATASTFGCVIRRPNLVATMLGV